MSASARYNPIEIPGHANISLVQFRGHFRRAVDSNECVDFIVLCFVHVDIFDSHDQSR